MGTVTHHVHSVHISPAGPETKLAFSLWLKPDSITFRLLLCPHCLFRLYVICSRKFSTTFSFFLAQMAVLEGEVGDLKHKVRGHQQEACQLSKKIRDAEALTEQREKEQQQLQDQLCFGQQRVRTNSHTSSCACLQRTWILWLNP